MPSYRQKLKPRFAVLGAVCFAVLVLLLLRLWTMQVLSGEAYAAQAENNRVREVTTEAPRGRILDRNGEPLVTNRSTLTVAVARSAAEDDEMLTRLSAVLDMTVEELKERASSKREAALAPRVVAIDVPMSTVAYLSENEAQFPGVEVQARAVREYPNGSLAAHVLGYTGEMSQAEIDSPDFVGYSPTDIVGKTGAERSFESVLQGDRGRKLLEVDARGRPRKLIQDIEPEPGRDVVLTIDLEAQRVAEDALQDAIRDAHRQGFKKAKAGAVVALDVQTGEVLAMASAPTYDPTVFLGGISTDQWRSLTSTSSEFPLTNRAITAQYPPASTFKAFTGLAGLERGVTTQWSSYYCSGTWTGMGEDWSKRCWKRTGHGTESFMDGMADSCDIVFYEIGHDFYKREGEELQDFLTDFGFGQLMGIDLPGETKGRVPTAEWKKAFNEDYPEYQRWLPGDTVNMSIGQGDVLATPLQVAATYAGIGNGGKVLRPHVLRQVLSSDGEPVLTSEPEVVFEPEVKKQNLDIIHQSLVGVITRGTGQAAFRGFPVQVAGKTGTAEVNKKDDMAWFVGYAPANNPKYVVVTVLEQGGGGGSVAAPAVRQVLAQLLGERVEHVTTAKDVSR
jgi:penicillin-binding protein 2